MRCHTKHKHWILLDFFGERAGIRTLDLLIKSQLLYRLSYALPEGEQIVPGSAAEHTGDFQNGQHHKIKFLQHKFKKTTSIGRFPR